MKMDFAIAAIAVSLLGCSSVLAQVGGAGASSIGAASPLATSSASPVGPVGIPLGATEMAAPGISPAPLPTMGATGCSAAGSPMSQTATPLFDGGGATGAASSACATTSSSGASNTGSSMPFLSTLQVGRVGIPLGSTELGSAGLSPPPPVSTMFLSPIGPSTVAPLSTMSSPPSTTATPPCAVTGTFPDGSTTRQVRSTSSSAATTGVPGC